MHSQPNARLTQRGRLWLVIQHWRKASASRSWPPRTESASAAPFAGWLVTALAVGPLWQIDGVFAAPSGGRLISSSCSTPLRLSTCASACATSPGCSMPISRPSPGPSTTGLGPSRNLDPKPTVQRYECERPGDLIHIDIKSLARFRKVGHRITGDRQQGRSTGVGYDKVHVAIDDATRLAYVEVLTDEQKPTVIGFLSRAVAWFDGQEIECRRVMSDNGPAYVSKAFAIACRILGLRHIRTRPYTPRTNSKAERFIQTLCKKWAYAMAFPNSEERKRWLTRYLGIYNRLRKHSALGWLSPQQRLAELLR